MTKINIDYVVIVNDKYYNARYNPAPGEVNPEDLAVTDLTPILIHNRQNVDLTLTLQSSSL